MEEKSVYHISVYNPDEATIEEIQKIGKLFSTDYENEYIAVVRGYDNFVKMCNLVKQKILAD